MPSEINYQFPSHIIDIIGVCWHSDPLFRPDFSQLVPELEKHAPSDDQRFSVMLESRNTYEGILADDDEAVSDLDEESQLDDEGICEEQKIVSKLKNRWEQLSFGDIKGNISHQQK